MALRWDLRPLFPNRSPDTFIGQITIQSAISIGFAVFGLVLSLIMINVYDLPGWLFLIPFITTVAAFNAGQLITTFDDEYEPEIREP